MAKLSVELNRYFFEEDRDVKVTLEDILSLAEERIFGFLFVILKAVGPQIPRPFFWESSIENKTLLFRI